MARVGRPAVDANVQTESAQIDVTLGAVMAELAERLKRPEPELVHVATMRLDMIADRRRLDNAALEAERAQWIFALMPSNASPALRGVPLIPLRRLAANASSST